MRIVYEDGAVIVVVKPAGTLSQAGKGPSLLPALSAHTGAPVYPVHRLDLETSGLMVYAKTKAAAAQLCAAIAAGGLEKTYLCICHGAPPDGGEWTDLLFHDRNRNKTYVVTRMRAGVKEARLAFTVLGRKEAKSGEVSLCRVRLFTGRTHQIRVQFASRSYPLVGDRKYGAKDGEKTLFLHASELSFPHPETNVRMTFTDLPAWAEEKAE